IAAAGERAGRSDEGSGSPQLGGGDELVRRRRLEAGERAASNVLRQGSLRTVVVERNRFKRSPAARLERRADHDGEIVFSFQLCQFFTTKWLHPKAQGRASRTLGNQAPFSTYPEGVASRTMVPLRGTFDFSNLPQVRETRPGALRFNAVGVKERRIDS